MLFGVVRIPDIRLAEPSFFLLWHGEYPFIRGQQNHVLALRGDVVPALRACMVAGRTSRWALPIPKDGSVLVPAYDKRTTGRRRRNPQSQHASRRLVLCARYKAC